MADIADVAGDYYDKFIAHAAAVRKPTLTPCGHCHYCSEVVHPGNLFCGTDCAHDWERESEAKKRNGKH